MYMNFIIFAMATNARLVLCDELKRKESVTLIGSS